MKVACRYAGAVLFCVGLFACNPTDAGDEPGVQVDEPAASSGYFPLTWTDPGEAGCDEWTDTETGNTCKVCVDDAGVETMTCDTPPEAPDADTCRVWMASDGNTCDICGKGVVDDDFRCTAPEECETFVDETGNPCKKCSGEHGDTVVCSPPPEQCAQVVGHNGAVCTKCEGADGKTYTDCDHPKEACTFSADESQVCTTCGEERNCTRPPERQCRRTVDDEGAVCMKCVSEDGATETEECMAPPEGCTVERDDHGNMCKTCDRDGTKYTECHRPPVECTTSHNDDGKVCTTCTRADAEPGEDPEIHCARPWEDSCDEFVDDEGRECVKCLDDDGEAHVRCRPVFEPPGEDSCTKFVNEDGQACRTCTDPEGNAHTRCREPECRTFEQPDGQVCTKCADEDAPRCCARNEEEQCHPFVDGDGRHCVKCPARGEKPAQVNCRPPEHEGCRLEDRDGLVCRVCEDDDSVEENCDHPASDCAVSHANGQVCTQCPDDPEPRCERPYENRCHPFVNEDGKHCVECPAQHGEPTQVHCRPPEHAGCELEDQDGLVCRVCTDPVSGEVRESCDEPTPTCAVSRENDGPVCTQCAGELVAQCERPYGEHCEEFVNDGLRCKKCPGPNNSAAITECAPPVAEENENCVREVVDGAICRVCTQEALVKRDCEHSGPSCETRETDDGRVCTTCQTTVGVAPAEHCERPYACSDFVNNEGEHCVECPAETEGGQSTVHCRTPEPAGEGICTESIDEDGRRCQECVALDGQVHKRCEEPAPECAPESQSDGRVCYRCGTDLNCPREEAEACHEELNEAGKMCLKCPGEADYCSSNEEPQCGHPYVSDGQRCEECRSTTAHVTRCHPPRDGCSFEENDHGAVCQVCPDGRRCEGEPVPPPGLGGGF